MAKKPEEYEDEEEYEEVDEEQERIQKIKHQILDEMSQYKVNSADYKECLQRLVDIGEYERQIASTRRDEAEAIRSKKEADQVDHQKYAWILPTAIQTGAQCITQFAIAVMQSAFNRRNCKDVLHHEDSGEIITSKAYGFVDKKH